MSRLIIQPLLSRGDQNLCRWLGLQRRGPGPKAEPQLPYLRYGDVDLPLRHKALPAPPPPPCYPAFQGRAQKRPREVGQVTAEALGWQACCCGRGEGPLPALS